MANRMKYVQQNQESLLDADHNYAGSVSGTNCYQGLLGFNNGPTTLTSQVCHQRQDQACCRPIRALDDRKYNHLSCQEQSHLNEMEIPSFVSTKLSGILMSKQTIHVLHQSMY
jgi:hypothetical protein